MPGKKSHHRIISCIGIVELRRLVIVMLGLSAMSGFALAHSPSAVDVSYDETSGDLTVTITHQVDDPTSHYIRQVTVKQGATVLIDQSYTSQPGKSTFTNRYNLPQLKGSTGEVRVDTVCNMIGSRTGTLMLTRTQVPPGTQPSGAESPVPSPTKAGALPIIALLATGFAATRILR